MICFVYFVRYTEVTYRPVRNVTSRSTYGCCKVVKQLPDSVQLIVINNSGNCLPSLLLFKLNYFVVVATYSILVYVR